MPVLIALVYELGEIGVDLGLQGCGEPRPRTFATDLVKFERPSAPASSLFTTLNIGVPSSPAR
jgi:hypothetical protein